MKGTSQEYRNTFQVKKRGNRLIKNRRHGPPFIEINSHWVVRYFLIIYFTVRNYLSLNIPGHFILVSLWKIFRYTGRQYFLHTNLDPITV